MNNYYNNFTTFNDTKKCKNNYDVAENELNKNIMHMTPVIEDILHIYYPKRRINTEMTHHYDEVFLDNGIIYIHYEHDKLLKRIEIQIEDRNNSINKCKIIHEILLYIDPVYSKKFSEYSRLKRRKHALYLFNAIRPNRGGSGAVNLPVPYPDAGAEGAGAGGAGATSTGFVPENYDPETMKYKRTGGKRTRRGTHRGIIAQKYK